MKRKTSLHHQAENPVRYDPAAQLKASFYYSPLTVLQSYGTHIIMSILAVNCNVPDLSHCAIPAPVDTSKILKMSLYFFLKPKPAEEQQPGLVLLDSTTGVFSEKLEQEQAMRYNTNTTQASV